MDLTIKKKSFHRTNTAEKGFPGDRRPFFFVDGEQFCFRDLLSILPAGHYLDYMKYCLMILPVSSRWSVFLQLKISFLDHDI